MFTTEYIAMVVVDYLALWNSYCKKWGVLNKNTYFDPNLIKHLNLLSHQIEIAVY